MPADEFAPDQDRPTFDPSQPQAVSGLILRIIDRTKLEDVQHLEMTEPGICDSVIIAGGTSSRQLTAVAETMRRLLREAGVSATVSGAGTGQWIVIDAGTVIVHLLTPQMRDLYKLEELYEARNAKALSTIRPEDDREA